MERSAIPTVTRLFSSIIPREKSAPLPTAPVITAPVIATPVLTALAALPELPVQ